MKEANVSFIFSSSKDEFKIISSYLTVGLAQKELSQPKLPKIPCLSFDFFSKLPMEENF